MIKLKHFRGLFIAYLGASIGLVSYYNSNPVEFMQRSNELMLCASALTIGYILALMYKK